MPITKTTTSTTTKENCDTQMASASPSAEEELPKAGAENHAISAVDRETKIATMPLPKTPTTTTPRATPTPTLLPLLASAAACNKQLLFCRRFKDSTASNATDGFLRNFNSLPLFVYATSPSTHATSADGVGVAKEAAAAAAAAFNQKNEGFELATTHGTSKTDGSCLSHNQNISSGSSASSNSGGCTRTTAKLAMECLPLTGAHHTHMMATANTNGGVSTAASSVLPTAAVVVGATYPHHMHHHHHHQLLSHHTPYGNASYALHHSGSHHHIHSEQTKSLQELQHEVGALLEFRDLVIETFPDLKHKMASMSATPTSASSVVVMGGAGGGSHSVGASGSSSSSLATRREWEPGIRMKRKLSHKEPSTTSAGGAGAVSTAAGGSGDTQLSSSSLTRSRSNSHSGKKEPKSGENNNGSVVQDSGFSTETSSSKEGHSASSTNGAMTVAIASNRLSCAESDDELLNLLDVIHRKSNRLREEVEQLQTYERQQSEVDAAKGPKNGSTMTPQQFREHVERLNREDITQLRKERDRLLDKLAEMEAETLTGRIKAAKMSDQVEELISVKKDLEEQLKLAMAQKLELSSRVQQLQQQNKSSSSGSPSEYSSQRNFLSSATTVLSNGSLAQAEQSRRANTFQPVVVIDQQPLASAADEHLAFHQSAGSDTTAAASAFLRKQQQQQPLGRLDGVVSTPGARNTKCRVADSKRFSAILLETNVLELQRHLLTLTVQNQVLLQKLDSSSKCKTHLAKRLEKNKEDNEHLRFQLEEKNIELEGTKAQLRVLESRMLASTPSATNSYLHSQNDYETNRSSASTTLMLSRRGLVDSVEARSSTPVSTTSPLAAMPQPQATQISTPSMKAMVHLPMDELQQHSSSTESAHEHELTHDETQSKTMTNMLAPIGSSTPTSTAGGASAGIGPAAGSISARVMSTSVGGVSPFEQTPPRGAAFRKFQSASKPSKIPLPGSKAAAYFGAAGKPPTGRSSTAARSPPSANTSSTSYGSSRSSLSRSTGNLQLGKSPQSLKRADSAQSISGRKDASNHSLSTNTSRSSTSSSIPLATTPYSSSSGGGGTGSGGQRTSTTTANTTPSPRVLQNSPLPRLKREAMKARLSNTMAPLKPSAGSIAAQLNSTLRQDLQLSSSAAQTFQRRATGGGNSGGSGGAAERVTRRFSSASVAARHTDSTTAGAGAGAGTPTSSYGDSDSGKVIENCN
ncbi:mucin-22 isoform X2 [Scaptodrosophila lebanonensis]|uniref:Mucin-22 isoform X2 n=1 Tax=Drosophila lebanonensis TaxID=7225 RepID=A0A6J2T0Z8_DROLE|nr:mucin-22 isoform X2 [Scaptodrosophila lebanonensis]